MEGFVSDPAIHALQTPQHSYAAALQTATPEEKRLKLRAIKKDYIILACLLVAGSTYAFKRFRPESAPAPALEPHPLGKRGSTIP